MKQSLTFLFAIVFSCTATWADPTTHGSKPFAFEAYIAALEKEQSGGVFVAGCMTSNGDQGVLIFPMGQRDGRFFELRGSHAIRSGTVRISGGTYEMQPDTLADQARRAMHIMKTLIMSPYFVLTNFQLGTIISVHPKQECFEDEP